MFNKEKLETFHNKYYLKLLIIPALMLVFSLTFLGINYIETGEFISKDVTLKGGLTATVYSDQPIDLQEMTDFLKGKFPDKDIIVRKLTDFNTDKDLGITIEADLISDQEKNLKDSLKEKIDFEEEQYSIEETGATLGKSFFREMISALIFAFIFMGIVIFVSFRTFVPSFVVIMSAVFDMVVTLSIISFMGMRLSSAGISAFLLIIGYSVDTDILIATKLLKHKGVRGEFEMTYEAMKTGLTMTLTTAGALLAGYLLTNSLVLEQMFLILLISCFVDIPSTWITSTGLLKYYIKGRNGD